MQFTEDLSGMTLVDQPGSLDNINVSPIAFDDSGYTAAGNVSFTAAVSVLANDTEPLGPEGLALNTGTAIQNTGVAFATSQGGSVTLNANGTFTYVSAVGFEGTDTFTYTLRDTGLDGVAGNADDLTSGTGTVSITVGPSVWFIDNTAPGSGNGTQAEPVQLDRRLQCRARHGQRSGRGRLHLPARHRHLHAKPTASTSPTARR